MDFIESADEFIARIRNLDVKLNKIRLSSVRIDKKAQTVTYAFICPEAVDQALKEKIADEASALTPDAFKKVSVTVSKIMCDDTLINNEIYKYVNKQFPSLSFGLKESDVRSYVYGDSVKYVLRLSASDSERFLKGAILKLNEHLERTFCADFIGSTEIREEEDVPLGDLRAEVYADQLQNISLRTIKVEAVTVIDDQYMGDVARYIEDATEGDVVLCGNIIDITEKETKNGKPFFIIRIDDTTGVIGGVYFTKKSTYEKIKTLAVGDAIITRGTVGEYKGNPSFTFGKINRCVFPSDFVKQEKTRKTLPKDYTLIFPTPSETVKVVSVFDEDKTLPKELTENEYVVFDLETTGFDVLNNGITEIGAVRLKNGKIVEQFTTLINPEYPISEENFSVTGISYDMVKDKPKIAQVLPDFLKFTEGAILVGHNAIDFDMRFIKRFAGIEDYAVNNKVMDTWILSKQYLKDLKNFDLHTVANSFNITFHHHRALSDAYATAEIFIELMKIINKQN